ncbi:RNA-directed DNA polymerase [Gossypium australe]|uniref:RNA-directed DNA polymerase n=1 Tax=Gossypium australe TaxID=47621 RepID=A0A5B6WG54_9ROSI|nr:RNA-directed DNA polymerase [Gossypium australe]
MVGNHEIQILLIHHGTRQNSCASFTSSCYDFFMPFSMLGMDVIGPISPKAFNGHRFIFVVIDYFTKWVEAASYANVTKSTVSKFLNKEIICRYRMLERIISDNALNLNNSTIVEVYSQFKIKHHNSSPYLTKMNGAVERLINIGMRNYHFPSMLIERLLEPPPGQCLSHRFMEWRQSCLLKSRFLLSKVEVKRNRIDPISYDQLNLIEEKRLKRKMDAELGMTLYGKESLFLRSTNFGRDGQQKPAQFREFRFS